jgi:septum site-determining protein MinC
VAGQYRVMESIPAELRGKPVQIWLENDKLQIAVMA